MAAFASCVAAKLVFFLLCDRSQAPVAMLASAFTPPLDSGIELSQKGDVVRADVTKLDANGLQELDSDEPDPRA